MPTKPDSGSFLKDREKLISSLEFFLERAMDDLNHVEHGLVFDELADRLRKRGIQAPTINQTPYINTIEPDTSSRAMIRATP